VSTFQQKNQDFKKRFCKGRPPVTDYIKRSWSTYHIGGPSVWYHRSVLICNHHLLHVLKRRVRRHYIPERWLVLLYYTWNKARNETLI